MKPFPAEDAAWIRTHAWTPAMRRAARSGFFTRCACWGWNPCQQSEHDRCGPPPGLVTANYALIGDLASRATQERIWQATTCRWICNCPHHTAVQLDLFGAAA